jgi:predicted permease
MTTLWQDVRFGMRMLRKSPGFTAIALVTLAVGIGANTIMFSVVNVLLLRPVSLRDPDRLAGCGVRNGWYSYSAYLALRDDNPVFSDLMAHGGSFHFVTLMQGDVARRVNPLFVSANYFSTLGVALAQGRAFSPEEERKGAEPVAILSHRAWQRHGADPDVVGTQVAINGTFFRVVGVAPKGFTGTGIVGPDLWLPLGAYGLVGHEGQSRPSPEPDEGWDYSMLSLVGRLKPGLDMTAAEARLQSLVPRLKEDYPRQWKPNSTLYLYRPARLLAGEQGDGSALSAAGAFLMIVSAVVLLIACLNLANMTMVQGAARRREIAIRMAIGGGRLRIMRQLFVESLLLAVLGGACGLILAFWGARMLNAWIAVPQMEMDLAGAFRMGLDMRVLAATLGFCLVAAVLSGAKPALRLSRRDTSAALKSSGSGVLRSTGRVRRPHGLSVLLQIALSVVLVMGAALFTRSAMKTAPADWGFRLDDKLIIKLDSMAAGYDPAHTQQVYESLAQHLWALPGVRAVSVSASFPLAEGGSGGPVCEYDPGAAEDLRDEAQVLRERVANPPRETSKRYTVGLDYFDAMGMPLLQGRAFHRLDHSPAAEKVAIIDECLARRLRRDGNALGCLIQCDRRFSPAPYRVVGIAPSLRIVSDNDFNPTQIYVPLDSDARPAFIHLRVASGSRRAAASLLRQIASEIRRIDPRLPILSATPLADFHTANPFVWLWGFGARLAALFGGMALFLASLGIYAVKGHMVALRTPEIGVRKALGATQRDIMGMVLHEGLALTLAGLAVGLVLALAAGRVIASLLYGVGSVDPVSIVATVTLLGAASLLAGYIPARRAARVDPMVAVRYE